MSELARDLAWERPAAALLLQAERGAAVVGHATPLELDRELAELAAALATGGAREPRFAYQAAAKSDTAAQLSRLAEGLDAIGDPASLLYAARARELALERRLCESVGTAAFFALARQRYPRRDRFDAEADQVAQAWLAPHARDADDTASAERASLSDAPSEPERTSVSDDASDPASLVSRMRAELGARRLPVVVKVEARMSALAATGNGVVYVCVGRQITSSDVERTVLHELDGHVAPRHRADSMSLGIFRVGTAFGGDDQEGRALVCEDRGGFLTRPRRTELGRRHVASRMVEAQASFVDVARQLMDVGAAPADAARIAARAVRGGGLAREVAYLPAYLRVKHALASSPRDEQLLAAGRIAVDALAVLTPMLSPGVAFAYRA